MKVAILCGGKGTRLAELTEAIPKGLIPIGDQPIVWHIMQYFASFGHTEFVLLVGYMAAKFEQYVKTTPANWSVVCVDAGSEATKSERLLAAAAHLRSDRFFLAYGDDLCTVDLDQVVRANDASQAVVTLTAVRPPNPFGVIEIDPAGRVTSFREKEQSADWINGGYMVARPALFDELGRGELETVVLPHLAKQGSVDVWAHDGFWMSMNTFKESQELAAMWRAGAPPWRRWEDSR